MVNPTSRMLAACAAIAFVAFAPGAKAQLGVYFPGLGGNLSVVIPTEGLQSQYKVGFGGGIVLEPAIPGTWSATGEIGFTRLLGQTRIVGGIEDRTPDESVWEFSGGVRRKLGSSAWFVGVDGAYYVFSLNGSLGLEDEGGLLPAVGFRATGLGLTARYKLLGDVHWVQLRLSINNAFR
jgi:hypothetical protein